MKTYNLIICEYISFGFIDYLVNSKSLLDYTNLFFLINMKKKD